MFTEGKLRLMWLDDLFNRLVHNNRREAMEALLNALVPCSRKDEYRHAAKEVAMGHFEGDAHRESSARGCYVAGRDLRPHHRNRELNRALMMMAKVT
jgi:hypothetical protein